MNRRGLAGLAAGLMALTMQAAEPAAPAEPAVARGSQVACSVDAAMARKYPEQVVLITCIDTNGRANVMTAGWVMSCSGNPPMVAVAIGKTRYTHAQILASKEFVVAMPTEDMKDAVMLCGTRSGRDTDKFKEAKLTAQTGLQVKAPLIEECLVNLECRLESTLDTGSHTIFVGRIVQAWSSGAEPGKKRLFNMGKREFKGLP
jgi:flavin reductase (DIM6/NTAB) family NADH-FMN oxidoreductase RutF